MYLLSFFIVAVAAGGVAAEPTINYDEKNYTTEIVLPSQNYNANPYPTDSYRPSNYGSQDNYAPPTNYAPQTNYAQDNYNSGGLDYNAPTSTYGDSYAPSGYGRRRKHRKCCSCGGGGYGGGGYGGRKSYNTNYGIPDTDEYRTSSYRSNVNTYGDDEYAAPSRVPSYERNSYGGGYERNAYGGGYERNAYGGGYERPVY